ncbi:hypothetical protein CN140_02645 [Sinorhizobium meliloti]|uniref:Uncharacterized protein n=1 Tax=Rhizobium meliloti TaxID=382 RepID=A0AAW9TR80_RHIML|nr:hypothetical protein [Sinorhizobium meliloti]MCM5689520.1 hypothetical protein [Sinorhizobium meliloti]MQW35048.1 hypothetical protein [Sinorhizobium meliloti]RVL87473.1 hypothetical protein CN140_02645 [Sinorhizobium meliloti]
MLTVNHNGATRTVILTRRYALKLPSFKSWRLFLQGLLANMQEREFGKAERDGLCPVLFSIPGGLLVVMPRCSALTTKNGRARLQRICGPGRLCAAGRAQTRQLWLDEWKDRGL